MVFAQHLKQHLKTLGLKATDGFKAGGSSGKSTVYTRLKPVT